MPVIAFIFFLLLNCPQDVNERNNHPAFIASSYHGSQVRHLSAWPPESNDEVGRDLLPFASGKAILMVTAAAPRESTLIRAITNG